MIDYLEHYMRSYGQFVRDKRLGGATPLTMLEIFQPAGDFSDPPVRDLTMIRLMTPVRGRIDFGAGRRPSAEAGLVSVVPAGCATDIVVDGPHMFRTYSLPGDLTAAVLEECLDGTAPDLTSLQTVGTHDLMLRTILDRLWETGAQDGSVDRLLCDSAVLTVLTVLAREALSCTLPKAGGLAPWQVRRVGDWVETAIDRQISLGEMAHTVDLSPFHFARAFKATTGMTPLYYVAQRRLARAQALLHQTGLALVDVAAACGFANQSSFTTAFKRDTGLTPARWRKTARSVSVYALRGPAEVRPSG